MVLKGIRFAYIAGLPNGKATVCSRPRGMSSRMMQLVQYCHRVIAIFFGILSAWRGKDTSIVNPRKRERWTYPDCRFFGPTFFSGLATERKSCASE